MLTVAREGVVGKPDALAQDWPMCEGHWAVSDTGLVPPDTTAPKRTKP
jgi:hypothetical protein